MSLLMLMVNGVGDDRRELHNNIILYPVAVFLLFNVFMRAQNIKSLNERAGGARGGELKKKTAENMFNEPIYINYYRDLNFRL